MLPFTGFFSRKEPWVALDLLGEVGMLSDGINNDGILLALPFEEVAGCDFWETEYVREVRMLVACKFSDVPLSYLL